MGAVVVKAGRIIGRAATAGRRIRPPWPTPRSRRFTGLARRWALGGLPAATCTCYLRALSHVCRGHYQLPHGPGGLWRDDERAGCCGTALDLFALPTATGRIFTGASYEAEAKALLQEFFQKLRK